MVWLQNARKDDNKRLKHLPQDGRMHLDSLQQPKSLPLQMTTMGMFSIFESLNRTKRSSQDFIHLSLRHVSINTNEIGLNNAHTNYHLGLDMSITRLKWNTCLGYMDGVIIYSNSVKKKISEVEDKLNTLTVSGFAIKMFKYTLYIDKLEHLGDIIFPGKLEIDHLHTD